MFTGLVEEIGYLKRVSRHGEALLLVIEAETVLSDIKIGDSIAVNGICLTVTAFDRQTFTADVTPQTYRFSNLHALRPGDPINLERAMQAGGRFGGHIVQGHGDGTARIVKQVTEANMIVFSFEADSPSLLRYIIPQGSITVDGVSLTVSSCEQAAFSAAVIPHTFKQTTLRYKTIGSKVNIECDILGKYIEQLLRKSEERAAAGENKLSASFLQEHGFL